MVYVLVISVLEMSHTNIEQLILADKRAFNLLKLSIFIESLCLREIDSLLGRKCYMQSWDYTEIHCGKCTSREALHVLCGYLQPPPGLHITVSDIMNNGTENKQVSG